VNLPDLPLTRRTTLSGLAAISTISLVSSCGTGSGTDSDEPALDGLSQDEQAAVQAQRSVTLALAEVDRASRDRPGLVGLLSPIAAMHRNHLEVLDQVADPDPPATPSAAPLPAGRRALLNDLAAREAVLARELADLAQKSESGKWARVLASMAAGVNQHRLSLATGTGGES
jgi:hypothetical protein